MRYLSNKEVGVILGVSASTITRVLKGQFGGELRQPILGARRVTVGGSVRWDARSLGEIIGKSEAEIERILA